MKPSSKTFAINRRARFDYEISETLEAGIMLLGTEIKAMREGRANLSDAYARNMSGEIYLINAHIGQYSNARPGTNHEPKRSRKLLLKKAQISKLISQLDERGFTLVPIKIYLKNNRAKIELGVGRGKKLYDKRQSIIEKERNREATRALSYKQNNFS
jgi:SsrA-binding protein